ncbi:MAG: hypothetical protein NTU98_09230 [Bacteroidetes bacterium]|nr:hypothetical protein [Bacteroidota bacterium]
MNKYITGITSPSQIYERLPFYPNGIIAGDKNLLQQASANPFLKKQAINPLLSICNAAQRGINSLGQFILYL